MRRAVKSPRQRPWLRLACALLGLLLVAGTLSRSSYYFCAALQKSHATPCCKASSKSSSHGPAVAPLCCEERLSEVAGQPGTPPDAPVALAIAPAGLSELLPALQRPPAGSTLKAPRWPIRAGPAHASQLVVKLGVLLS